MAGWLGGWLRKAENKAKAQQSWGLGFAELSKISLAGFIQGSLWVSLKVQEGHLSLGKALKGQKCVPFCLYN